MPERITSGPEFPTSRRTTPPPPQLPDLFGFVAPASATKPTTPRPDAEWPAAPAVPPGSPPPPRRAAAGDRPSTPAGSLSGTYDRTGARLRRSDGLALVVCLSHRGVRTARDSGRYVTVATPGGGRPRYAGNLYGPAPDGPDDLSGAEFQDGADRTRYALALVSADRYAVRALPRGRRTAGAAA